MSERSHRDHWEALAEQLGARPEPEPLSPIPKPAQPPVSRRIPAVPRARKPPTDWTDVALSLGLTVPPEPVVPVRPAPPARTPRSAPRLPADTSAASPVLPTEAPPALTGSEAVAPSRGRPEHRPQRQKQQRPETVAESAGPAEFSPAADEASDEPGPENVPRRRRRRRRGRKNGRREREAAQAGGPPEPSSGDDLEGPTSEAAAVPRAQPETGEEQMAASGSDERRRGRRKRRRRGRKPAAAASEATAELSAESCEISDLEPLNDDEEVESQERVVEAAAAADVDDLEPVAAHPSHHETALLPGGAEDEGDDAGSEKPHRSIPTWEEAVGVVIGANMESRAKSPRPPRGRPRGR